MSLSLFSNLKTSRKFTLLGALAAVAILLPCILFARLAWQDYDFARQELHGVPVVNRLYDALRLAQEHRGLSNALLAGTTTVADKRAAKAAEIQQAIAAVSTELDRAGLTELQTSWQAFGRDWQTLVADVAAAKVDARQSFARHTALIERELGMLGAALDRYNWSLDPEAHTYFTIVATAMEGVQVTERLGQLRALGAAALSRRNLTPDERLQAHALATLAGESFGRAAVALNKARAADPAYDAALAPLQDKLAKDLQAVSRLASEQIVNASLDIEPTAYFDALTGVIRQQFELNRAGSGLIEASLTERVAGVRHTMIGLGLGLLCAAAAFAAFAWHLARTTTQRLESAREVAAAMATGDLSLSIPQAGRDELGQLLDALRTMQHQLAGIVGGVRRNAEQVATASQQIAQGNGDLSARTEQQASSLEQTAASMEQINGTIRQNADNARQANELALGASGVAEQGGEVVGRVVATMQGIHESSSKIADIIGVIDGIAFQTNILALNAAVEAARAGEQGRGFAVVASEVRSLAQRSAQAAKEIKSLIAVSVERVGEGNALVGQAGQTMHEIVESIQRVAGIVSQIALASQEQATGVGQVSEAVAHMDQATQQNAALVEQSAAAAESLRNQAHQLVGAVSVFKVNPAD